MPDGNGKKTYFDGNYYEGEWKNGLRHGKGVETYYGMKGRYTGEWKEDMKEGSGEEVYKNGDTYEGGFKAGKKHGQGKYVW